MHVRPTTHRRRVGRYGAAALVAFSLVAAACGDKKDDDEVATDDTEADVEDTTPATPRPTTRAEVTTPETETTEAPAPVVTEPPESEFDPVIGGKLVVAGEAEAANPWTPANVQCDSYCQMRVRAFYDPLVAVDDDLEVQPYLAESITPNEDSTEFTIKLREGITFHDGTPLDADAVMDNLNRSFRSLLIGAAVKDIARNVADPGADPSNPQILFEKIDDFTFTIFTGINGDPDAADPVADVPDLPRRPGRASWPRRRGSPPSTPARRSPTDAVGTGPFVFQSYAPGDRLIVTKNPDYWRTDENGNQLPYLDEIEFRVIVDSQVRAQALESGDVDMIATSDSNVIVDYLDNPDFPMVLQNQFAETNYWLLHLTIPPLDNRDVRCALQQAIDKADYIDVVNSGYGEPANGPFSPGQEGYLDDNGGPEYDPEAAPAAIEAYEAANGPITINYSTTPTATSLTRAQFVADAWGAIGVDIVDQPDRAVDADQQRPVRRSAVRRLRLAQPRRLLRRPAVLLVAQLGGDRRRRAWR